MSPRTPAFALLLGTGLVACDPQEDEETKDEVSGITELDPREQLIRLSVDLRGKHPTEAELVSVDPDFGGDPRLYDDYVDYWLEQPQFVDRMKEVFNFRYLTRTGEDYYGDWENVGLGGVSTNVIADAVAEEPLALLGHIVENDLPYSEIVLADYVIANDIVASAWGLDFLEEGDGWRKAIYADSRPMQGVLTMQTIWERYPSMGGNANRHRANAMSKMFLCDDYLSRPIVLNRAAIDQLTLDPEAAIATDGCQSCHSTLDPLAAHFFGWFRIDDALGVVDGTTYRPEWEMTWMDYSGKSPGYYGVPTGNMAELANNLAADDRFSQCAVKTIFEGLTQRKVADNDWEEVRGHLDTFQTSGMNIKDTVRSIVTSTEYKAGFVEDPDVADRIATVKMVTPAQLSSIVEAKTGYAWEFNGRNALTTNDLGLNVIAGGIDSMFVTEMTYEPTLGLVYIQKRLAQSAAYHVVDRDFNVDVEAGEEAELLKYITINDNPEEDWERFDTQVRYLYQHFTGVPLPDEATEPELLKEMWIDVHSMEGPEMAWTAVVSSILRDPRIILY